MKKIFTLLFLAIGLTAAAQTSDKYELFKELRNEADTTGMKNMLDNWGDKDAEFYAAWVNYCSVMAEESEDPTWLEMGVNWAKMGRDTYPDNELLLHKQSDALFDNEQFQEALPLLEEIEQKGLGDIITWHHLAVIYGAKGDFTQSRKYLEKMIQSGDEEDQAYAQEVMAVYDELERQADSLAFHPDHAAIKAVSQTPAYQELTARFAACDSTLTREEIATVYYGAAYIHNYEYVQAECADIRTLADEGKIKEAKEALEAKLKEYPVSLFLLISLFNLAESEEELRSPVWKAQQILTVIDNTGRLADPKQPFHVICINDEYIALEQILGAREVKSQAAVRGVADDPLDKMTFVNSYGLEQNAYFWLTPPYWERLNRLFGGND